MMKKRWISPCFGDKENSTKRSRTEKTVVKVNQPNKPIIADVAFGTWIDKYKPQTFEDLVIHPKKLEEIRHWLSKYKNCPDSACKYLLLSGPSGCGKTISLQVLAKSYEIPIIEWITPMDREYNVENDDYLPPLQIFKKFLSQASRYPSLLLPKSVPKIVLVKDFPNIFVYNPSSFHEVLTDILNTNLHTVVFIVSDENLSRKLFPDDLKTKCKIDTINFNSVHCKAVIKALKRIAILENKTERNLIVRDSDLENIYNSCGGDLRSAILKFYFNFVCLRKKTQDSMKNINKTSKTTTRDKTELCDLFVGLGRVLYAKRENNDKFVHNPDEIAEMFSTQSNYFVGFLQENYVSRFSDIKSISKAADRLSIVDCMLKCSQQENKSDNLALSVATRGLMVPNRYSVKSFKPFVKPRFYKDDVSKNDTKEKVRTLFPEFSQTVTSNIVLDILPLIRKTTYQLNQNQIQIVENVSFNIT